MPRRKIAALHLSGLFFKALALPCLLVLISLPSGLSSTPPLGKAQGEAEYAYYGRVPTDLYPNMTTASLHLIGNHPGTRVRVYSLPDKALLREFTVNPMERQVVQLPNGSFFKVASDKPVTTMLIGGSWEVNVTATVPGATTFHPSVDGGYVGKGFIFTTVEVVSTELANLPERVYALEDTDVKVFDVGGATLKSFSLKANKYASFILPSFGSYRVTSTGYIMVQTFSMGVYFGSICYYPAVEGGFIGTRFYGAGHFSQYTSADRWFAFMGAEDSKVAIIDLKNAQKVADVSFMAGKNASLPTNKLEPLNLAFESDKPITLMFQSREGGVPLFVEGGVTYAGLKAGQTGYFIVPGIRAEGYIFAYEETQIDVDDVKLRVPADGFVTLTTGLHKITADHNVLIQVVQLPLHVDDSLTILDQLNFGVSVPSVQSMSATYPDVSLKPFGVDGLPLLYIGAGAVLVMVVVVVVALALRRRGTPSS